MSAKATGLVWDLECPKKYGDIEFRPSHKFVLVSYADHADHNGKNIWPAVHTIHLKTGLDERSVQRITQDLKKIGLLIEDGKGPRGTNRWALPFNSKGDCLVPKRGDTMPPVEVPGDKNDKSLGDKPLGDISLGDTTPPELKELNQETIKYISTHVFDSWENLKEQIRPDFKKAQFETWIAPTEGISFDNLTMNVTTINPFSLKWLDENLKELAQTHLGVYIKFFVPDLVGERLGTDEP